MKKSPSDPKEYRFQRLSNGINLLQVKDPTSTSCAIAVKLNTGSFSDPADCQGLAHLLEHCMFTGSQNFPQDNTLTQFLDAHQGQLNAWTAGELTVFYFKVHQQFFLDALEIFFDMLLQPKFSLAGIAKELNAIDSEFLNKITEEQRRVLEVQKQVCNQEHPFAQFSVGNNQIFSKFTTEELQGKLRAYWQKAFYAGNLSVCISTTPEVSHCVEFANEQLCKFPEKQIEKIELPTLYLQEHLQKRIQIKTQRPHHRLVLIFSIREPDNDYTLKNDAFISHLYGYEGPGSLLNYWKSKKWATQVIVGTGLTGSNFLDFNLYIELTEPGLDYVDEITQSVLYFTQLIEKSDETPKQYAQKAQLNQIAFEHQSIQKPLDTVLHLVKNMELYPENDVIFGEFLMAEFNKKALKSLLSNIVPERLRVLTISPTHSPELCSQWYQVPYSVAEMSLNSASSELFKELESNLALPPPNKYVPDLDVQLPTVESIPYLFEQSGLSIWAGSNTVNSNDKGECFLSWRKNEDFCGLENVAHRKLFCSAMETKLNDLFYLARLAGMHYSFYSHQTGVGLHTSGFAEKQLNLTTDIIQEICQATPHCPDFELHKQEYLNTQLSSIRNKPLNRLFTALQAICVPASWLPEDLASVAHSATQADIYSTHQSLFSQYQLEGLIYGHWRSDDIDRFTKSLSELNGLQNSNNAQRTINLYNSEFGSFHFPCEHDDAATVVYLQSPGKNLQNQAYTMLVEVMLAGFYFDWMRNQKQLGYQVGTGYMPFNEHPGIALYIQSSVAGPDVLYHETKNGMQHFYAWLQTLNEQQWLRYQHSLVRQLGSNAISFEVRCQRYWSAIGRQPVDFEFEQHLQQVITEIDLSSLSHWFAEMFLQNDKEFCIFTAGSKPFSKGHFKQAMPSIYQFKKGKPGCS